MSLSLAVLLNVAGGNASLQSRVKAKSSKKRISRKVRPASETSPTVGGISFLTLTPDINGGVWVGGRVVNKGLLLHLGPRIKGHSLPSIAWIDDIHFTTKEAGWFITRGDVYATKDGGRRWDRVEIEQQGVFTTVYFVNDHIGWVIGQAGTIYRTTDGGQTWRKQNSGTRYNLAQIQFANPQDGWVLADDPQHKFIARVLLSTHDGGNTWNLTSPSDSPLLLRGFSFVDEYKGWAIDADSNVLNTIDGGQTWVLQRPAREDAWQSICFINDSEGWIVGDGILHTKNGGITWNYQLPPSNRDGVKFLDKVYFADSKQGWALGFFRVLQTNDGGKTWSPIPDEWKAPVVTKILVDLSKTPKEIVEND
jgi:photosystem II stability/assembly factor-like uncharacterized protein